MSGVLRHALFVVTSMVDVAAASAGRLGAIYRAALLTVTPGAMLFVLAAAAGFVIVDDNIRRLALTLLALGTAAAALYMRRFGTYARLLWPWAAGVAAIAAASFLQPLEPDSHVVAAARVARMLGFTGVMTALNLAAIGMLVVSRHSPWSIRLARLALLYLPYIVINGVMTWATFLGFALFSRMPERYEMLEAMSTPPGLESIELASTLIIASLAVLAVGAPLALYAAGARSGVPFTNRKGRGAQDGLLAVLTIAPIALLALQLVVFWIAAQKPPSAGILAVYGTSILRTLPFLAWLVGPFAVALRVVGDVLFYVQPRGGHPAAIGDESRSRLRAALAYATRNPADEVIVVAHSQGSAIAADLRQRGELRCPLLTLGCPIASLYARFLGVDFIPAGSAGAPWINAYRNGDYIAGPIASPAVENRTDWRGRAYRLLDRRHARDHWRATAHGEG